MCQAPRCQLPLIGILALATALGFYNIGAKSMWLDEVLSMTFIQQPWSQLVQTWWHEEPNMGLYYASLKIWTSIFGTGEIAARSLSVIPAVATVWLTWRTGTKLFHRHVGLLAALILAINIPFLANAQEARAYSLLTFFAQPQRSASSMPPNSEAFAIGSFTR